MDVQNIEYLALNFVIATKLNCDIQINNPMVPYKTSVHSLHSCLKPEPTQVKDELDEYLPFSEQVIKEKQKESTTHRTPQLEVIFI